MIEHGIFAEVLRDRTIQIENYDEERITILIKFEQSDDNIAILQIESFILSMLSLFVRRFFIFSLDGCEK